MQKYDFYPETTKKFSKKFPLLSHFQRETRLENFTQELTEKSFAQRYEPLYFLGLLMAFVAQALSVWSSYATVEKLVQIKIHHPDILLGVTLALLLLIEVIKFYLVHLSLRDIFALKPIYPYPLLAAALLWSLGSIYLSVSGSSELAQDKAQETRLTAEQAGKEKALKNEIAQIQNTDTYKTIIWNGNGSTSKILTEAGKALVAKRESELDSLRKTYQLKTQQFQITQAQNIKNYNFFFALWEVLFLACTWGIFYYKRTCLIERELTNEPQTITTNQYEPQSTNHNQPNSNQYEPQTTINKHPIQTNSNQYEQLPTNNEQPNSNQYEQPVQNRFSTSKMKGLRKHFKKRLRTRSEPTPNPSELLNSKQHEQPNQEEIENAYQKILAQSNGKAKYLEKYKEATKQLLTLKYAEMPMQDICQTVTQDHDLGRTTFYNILRIINNQPEK